MIYEEYDFELLREYLLQKVSVVFVGKDNNDIRTQYVRNIFSKKTLIEIDYNSDMFELILGTNEVNCKMGEISSEIEKLVPSKISNDVILFDITSMKHTVIMGLVNALFKNIKPSKLFATYVVPDDYIKNNDNYEFTESVGSPECVECYVKHPNEETILIAFLGFEGGRMKKIISDETYLRKYPIFGFPSKNPIWRFTSLRMCMDDIDKNEPYESCGSHSVFGAYETIKEISELEINSGKPLMLAPLGTRPHTLAASIYASKKECGMMYDFPEEKRERAKGIKNTIVFHLSDFLMESL